MKIKSLIYSPSRWVGAHRPAKEGLKSIRSSFTGRPLTQSASTPRHERVGTVEGATLDAETGEIHVTINIPSIHEELVRAIATEKPYLGLEFVTFNGKAAMVIAIRVFFLAKDERVCTVDPFTIVEDRTGGAGACTFVEDDSETKE